MDRPSSIPADEAEKLSRLELFHAAIAYVVELGPPRFGQAASKVPNSTMQSPPGLSHGALVLHSKRAVKASAQAAPSASQAACRSAMHLSLYCSSRSLSLGSHITRCFANASHNSAESEAVVLLAVPGPAPVLPVLGPELAVIAPSEVFDDVPPEVDACVVSPEAEVLPSLSAAQAKARRGRRARNPKEQEDMNRIPSVRGGRGRIPSGSVDAGRRRTPTEDRRSDAKPN